MSNPVRWLSEAVARMPLRIKLVATVLALATIGLSAAAVAATTSLHSYLLGRVDDQLQSASGRITNGYGFHSGPVPGGGVTIGRGPQLPSEYYVVPFSADGVPDGSPQDAPLSAQSPPRLPKLTSTDIADLDGRPFTVSSMNGKLRWRVVAGRFRTGPAASRSRPRSAISTTRSIT